MIAAIGAPINKAAGGKCASPKIAAPDPDAATPARKSSESPGKAQPTSRPVSAKIIAKTPMRPRSETMEWASKRFMPGRLPHPYRPEVV